MEKSILVNGKWISTDSILEVYNPFSKEKYLTFQANEFHLNEIFADLDKNAKIAKSLSSFEKYDILLKTSILLQNQLEEIAQIIAFEAGKPIIYARSEVSRAIQTFSLAADLARTQKGEVLPLDLSIGNENRIGIVKNFPIGPILAISPFNFPLNLVAHKLAPAIASGNTIVLKPASKTPITSLILAEILLEAGFPPSCLSVIPCDRKTGQILVESDHFKLLTFTGSPQVGWKMKNEAKKKKVILELGGDAAVIIDESADLQVAAKKSAIGAFAYAGQICISVQRIVVLNTVYDEFMKHFMNEVQNLKFGNQMLENVVCGPLVDSKNHERTLNWIENAENLGANKLYGGENQQNNIISPCVMSEAPLNSFLRNEEAFAPIVCIIKVENWKSAIDKVNDSRFGLQTGIFTDSQSNIKYAFENLEVGGVIVNDVPTLRVDSMPYGGIKDSGLGREGVSYAFEDMTEPKILVW